MDYNYNIPDIYEKPYDKKFNIFDEKIQTYNLKSGEIKSIILPRDYLYLYFETVDTNIFFGDIKIWNKKILFNYMTINKTCNLENTSNIDVKINIHIIFSDKIINKIRLSKCIEYDKYTQPIYKMEYITCITDYGGLHVLHQLFIQTTTKIIDKIIKLNSFNISMFYKIKLLQYNDSQFYSYELLLCGIKNILTDEYMNIDLNNNIYDIYPKYLEIFKNLKIFMNNNTTHIRTNNIKIPDNITDPDGCKYIFYYLNIVNMIKKYNINYCETYLLLI